MFWFYVSHVHYTERKRMSSIDAVEEFEQLQQLCLRAVTGSKLDWL